MPAVTPRPKSLYRSTVGPDAALSTHVMYDAAAPPIQAQAWDGWATEWNLPNYQAVGFGTGMDDPSGYASRVSTVYTCVDLNSRQLGSFPIYGIEKKSGEHFDLPTWSATPEPELYADWSEFMKVLVNSYQIYGEAILWATATGSDGFPARFIVLNPANVKIEPAGDGTLGYSLSTNRGGYERLNPFDVLHIKFQVGTTSLRGISPLAWVGRNLVSAAALESYAADIAETGVWSVLKHPGNINRKQADDLKANWKTQRQLDPAAPAVLSGGIEFDTLSLSPKDMALLDLRVFDEQRIAGAFGVPAYLVGLPQPGGFTYVNATSLFDYHWRATLRPMANSIGQAMSRWLLPRGKSIEFNRDEYVRPGLEDRAQSYQILHDIQDETGPVLTVEEIRRQEHFGPMPAGAGENLIKTEPAVPFGGE